MTNEEWMANFERLMTDYGQSREERDWANAVKFAHAIKQHLSARPLPQATLSEERSALQRAEKALTRLANIDCGCVPCTGQCRTGPAAEIELEERMEYARTEALAARAVLAAARQVPVPPKIAAIIERLHTQDNRITANPLFAVQQKRRIYGLGSDYRDGTVFVDDEGIEFDERESVENGCREVGYRDTWEFVTGCLTEQGCKDYITANGHNLREPRIYAYGSYRNAEFIALREWLMGLASPSPVGQEEPGHKCGEGMRIVGVKGRSE